MNKSQRPSYIARSYLLQRLWMNYTTNQTLHLQLIDPLITKRKVEITIKTVRNPSLVFLEFTVRSQKKTIQIIRYFTTNQRAILFYLL